jgi:hypothetical protein
LKQARGPKLGGQGGHAGGEDGECNVSFHGWNGPIIPCWGREGNRESGIGNWL